jgi:hypothetical protein
VAAGWLAATAAGLVAGAAAGAAAGGIVGALMETGVSETHAHVFAEGIRQGGTLLTVRVEEAYGDEVKAILDAHGPIDPDQGLGGLGEVAASEIETRRTPLM